VKWWLKYRFLFLKPGSRIVVTYPDILSKRRHFKQEFPAEIAKAKWIRPKYAIDEYSPSSGKVFTGGWQLVVWYEPEPFGGTRVVPGTHLTKIKTKFDVVEFYDNWDGRLYGLVNQCRDGGGVHIRKDENVPR
jgi:hypothetical protein